MAFETEAAAFGDAAAAGVGIVAPEADAVGAKIIEREGHGAAGGFGEVTLVDVRAVGEEAEVERGQGVVGDPEIDLADELLRVAEEDAEDKRGALLPAPLEGAEHVGGVGFAVNGEDGVAGFVAGEVVAVALGHGEVPRRIVGAVGPQEETGGVEALGQGAELAKRHGKVDDVDCEDPVGEVDNRRHSVMSARMEREPLIQPHGGYRKLKSFQVAQLVYDLTVRFCERYIDRRSRTNDQMVQAARSGVQNIAEGSKASGTSKKTELKLTNVARASLEELRLDYEDFLRQRGLPLWDRGDRRRDELIARRCRTADEVAEWVREQHERGAAARAEVDGGRSGLTGLGGRSGPGGQKVASGEGPRSTESSKSRPSTYPEIAANAALVLIAVACGLLDRQIKAQAEAFEQEGGFTERLYRVRQQRRER